MRWRKRPDSDFQAEIESHIRFEADRLIASGISPEEAEFLARRSFGNPTIALERYHESRRWVWLEQLLQDLRYALRSMRKGPAFTAAAVLTIALGVGANTAIFSLVDAVLLRMLPVRNPKQLVFINAAGTEGSSGSPPYPCFERLRDGAEAFSGIAAFASDELKIEIDGVPEQVMGQVASGSYYDLLGLRPALGRLLTPLDENLDPPVAIISYSYWRRRFAGDLFVSGRTVSFRNQAFQIVGVTPPQFWGLHPGRPIDVTFPITTEGKLLADPGAWWFETIARLKPEVAASSAKAQSDTIYQSFMQGSRHSAEMLRKHFDHIELNPASHGLDLLRRRFSKPLFALMAIVGLILLIATANIANLLLARGAARAREFAIRLATGAGQSRLIRQILAETLLLFVCGALPGILLAQAGTVAIASLFATGRRPITLDAGLNIHVLAFTMSVTLAAGLLAATPSIWRAFRTDPQEAMPEGRSRTGESRGAGLVGRTLVSFQLALSLVILVAAAALIQTLANLRKADLGFQPGSVLTLSIEPSAAAGEPNSTVPFWSRVLESVRGIPGVRAAGLSIYTPLSGRDRGAMLTVPGFQPATTEDRIAHVNQVSDGYFETLGILLLRGRRFSESDSAAGPTVAIVNESAARKYFPNRDPIGESIEFDQRPSSRSSYRIVGVVRDTRHMNLREPAPPLVYIPVRQPRDGMPRLTLAVAASLPEGPLTASIRKAVATIDPQALISEVVSLNQQMNSTLLTERLLSGLSTAFASLALILAAVGTYGALSYRAGQQRQSIGIRIALGATPSSVARGVLHQVGAMIGYGLLAGFPCAYLAARASASLLWGLTSTDMAPYWQAATILCTIALASAYLPARRAALVDPAETLRHD